MERWILVVALLCPTLASGFEVGDLVVCRHHCVVSKDGEARTVKLPGSRFRVAAEKDGLVQSEGKDRGWVRAGALIAEKDASDYFRERIERDADDIVARCGLAIRFTEIDRDKALAEANEAVRRKQDWLTLACKASVHGDRREWKEAVTALDQAIAREPYTNLYELRAPACFNAGMWRQAVKDYTLLLRLDPSSDDLLVARGMAWGELKEVDKALADFDAAIRLQPDDVEYRITRAGAFLPAGKWEEGLAAIDEVLKEHSENARAHLMRGLLLQRRGDTAEAIAPYTKSLELDPTRSDALLARGQCWAEAENYEAAIADCDAAIKLDASRADYWAVRAMVHAGQEHFDRAIEDATEAVRLHPSAARWRYLRASIWLENEDYELALKGFEEALDLDSHDTHARCRQAWIYATCPEEKLRDGEKARKLVSPLYYLSWTVHCDVAESLAAAYAEKGDFEQAVIVQRKALDKAKGEKGRQAARERLELYEASKPYRLPTKQR